MGSAVKGGGAKGGGGKGGGGKGGGGKGKPGLGCLPGQVTLCFTKADYATLTAAFNGAVQSTGPSDGCIAGFMRVCLDTAAAQLLISTLVVALQGAIVKKKKKGKMKKSA
jgi:hypothetical protein